MQTIRENSCPRNDPTLSSDIIFLGRLSCTQRTTPIVMGLEQTWYGFFRYKDSGDKALLPKTFHNISSMSLVIRSFHSNSSSKMFEIMLTLEKILISETLSSHLVCLMRWLALPTGRSHRSFLRTVHLKIIASSC